MRDEGEWGAHRSDSSSSSSSLGFVCAAWSGVVIMSRWRVGVIYNKRFSYSPLLLFWYKRLKGKLSSSIGGGGCQRRQRNDVISQPIFDHKKMETFFLFFSDNKSERKEKWNNEDEIIMDKVMVVGGGSFSWAFLMIQSSSPIFDITMPFPPFFKFDGMSSC